MLGLGFSKRICGGITFSLSMYIAFTSEARPLAASVWPKLALTEPTRTGGEPTGRLRPKVRAIASASIGSPTLVPGSDYGLRSVSNFGNDATSRKGNKPVRWPSTKAVLAISRPAWA